MTRKAWARALEYTNKNAARTLPAVIDLPGQPQNDRIALLDQTETLTYRTLAIQMNRYARWAIDNRIAGETVALLMPNSCNYAAIWLGLTRAGCKVALLNTNLSPSALKHCITVAGAKYTIAIDELESVETLWPILAQNADPLDMPYPDPQDVALYIYTSGTTGLPKAVKITHRRISEWSYWFAGMIDAKPQDRLYNCLPMYHSIGGIVAIGSMLVVGGSVVIRERFSTSRFWSDVAESGCTVFQYIGELCRYLVAGPSDPNERNHQLRLAVGNGLQADVWLKFQDRFDIPHILEYYAATEGMLSLYNCEGKPGAIGRIPPYLEKFFAVKLIQVDQETGQPLRNADGFCIISATDEPGEAICPIKDRSFDGYNDVAASQSKIIHSVFVDGDRWYRTGDLMRKDASGFYFFLDRLGDTFRWKGENVSTTEVANVMRSCPGVTDAIVYGVQVSGNEGRAGMAAITTTEEFCFEGLTAHLNQHLPAYARPIFIRLCDTLDATGTFKPMKGRFAREGYIGATDPVWCYVESIEKFEQLGTWL